jgi:hypothetical protein
MAVDAPFDHLGHFLRQFPLCPRAPLFVRPDRLVEYYFHSTGAEAHRLAHDDRAVEFERHPGRKVRKNRRAFEELNLNARLDALIN